MDKKDTKKLSLKALVLMIFTSVFGFANMPRSYYLMGYGAIIWYIFAAFAFFIPFAFMMAEFGSAFEKEKGGIYSWMSKSVGPKFAFVGTFMWYASYIVWMVNISSSIWIPFSTSIFGDDRTAAWAAFGLNSTQVIGILGIIWIILVTRIASKGVEQITKITSIGGTAVAALNVVLIVGAVLIFIANGGILAEPLQGGNAFISSPNPAYQTTISSLGFLVFAIFSYGGIEVVGGLVDETENARVNFPKGITLAAIAISIGYSLGIFLCGVFTNWQSILSSNRIHMGNVAYILMKNFGYEFGRAFGFGEAVSIQLGIWVARFVGLSMFLALTGAFFALSYSPLKQLIDGTPQGLWTPKIEEIKDNIPVNAMWVQCGIVAVIIALVSFGGEGASKFFSRLILMTNVAMTLPYMFLSVAFPAFKKNTNIRKPFEFFKSYSIAFLATALVTLTVGFANLFTIIEPTIMKGDYMSTIWMIVGPVVFIIAALIIYGRYERKVKNKKIT